MKLNRIYILSLVALFLAISCVPPNEPQDIQSLKLKSETKWECNPSTRAKIAKISYKEYSQDGKLTKSINFNTIGNPVSVAEILYDKNIAVQTQNFFTSDGKIDSTIITTSKFDNSGKKVSQLESNVKGDTLVYNEFIYDLNGNLIKKTEQNNKSTKITETNYKLTYNNQGQVVERVQSFIGNSYFSKETYQFYPNENKVQKIITDFTGVILNINTYVFNDAGKIYVETIADNTGKVNKYFLYEYSYY